MRVLVCDGEQGFLKALCVSDTVDFVPAATAREAMQAGSVNLAVISQEVADWDFVAKNYVSQGAQVFIVTRDITNINTWKTSTEMGCKGVWPRENAAAELASRIQGGLLPAPGNKRPLRGQLVRTATKPSNAQALQRQNHEAMYRSQQAKAIIPREKLICFYGTNGGVAKTTMAINAGVAFAKQGKSTVIIDFDVFNGDVVTRLKVKPISTMVDWIKGNIDDLSQCLAEHSSGLRILPAPLNQEEGELISPEVTAKILSVLCRRFDVVVVDTSHLLIAPTMVSLENATTAYILCLPDSACVANTNKVLSKLEMLNFERYKLKLLVTKMPKKQPLRVVDMTSVLNLELGGVIPYDEALQIEVNQGIPPVLSRRARNFARAVNALCNIPNGSGRGMLESIFNRRAGGAV